MLYIPSISKRSFLMYERRHYCHIWHEMLLLRCGILYFKQTQVVAHLIPDLNSFQSWRTADPSFFFLSQVGGVCKVSTESSLRRCRTPDGKICSGRGKCDCGICICEATEPGKFFGPRCECHDWVCSVHNEKTCNGAYNDIGIDT